MKAEEQAGTRRSVDEETEIIELLAEVGAAEAEMQAALGRLQALVEATAEAPLMPNYERAEDQLRIAIRAAAGAQKALRRRLQLTRERARGR